MKELLEAHFIQPSKASYGALMIFQKNKDGSFQICIDHRALNKVIVKSSKEKSFFSLDGGKIS